MLKKENLTQLWEEKKKLRGYLKSYQEERKTIQSLLGEPGVGKSAIAEGLALRIVQRKVSRVLFNKRIISLDLASLVAGTKLQRSVRRKNEGGYE